MHLIQALVQLDIADREWDDKGRAYQAVRQRLADQSPLEARQRAQQERRAALSSNRGALRDGELELAALEEKARRTEDSLYAGRILAPRELDNLRRDLDQLKRRAAETEERVLALMQTVDDLQHAVAQGATDLEAFEAQWASEHARDMALYGELRTRLQELQAEREELRAHIEPRALALYDELRRSKAGMPLGAMSGGVCQVCRVTAPSAKAQLVERAEQTVVLCVGCGRILYRA
jgi:predicted  nucleic acid-binding Zn-ribbon protein